MDSKKSNKITDIVRLQQILKKWKKAANAPKNSSSNSSSTTTSTIKFIKRTLSFSDVSAATPSNNHDVVPKGSLAVCVGKELKRYVIPTEYLGHQAFGMLLREAEEEFGFQQEGVLKIPCEVSLFEKILKLVQDKRDHVCCNNLHDHELLLGLNSSSNNNNNVEKEIMMSNCWSSPDSDHLTVTPSHHPQLCR